MKCEIAEKAKVGSTKIKVSYMLIKNVSGWYPSSLWVLLSKWSEVGFNCAFSTFSPGFMSLNTSSIISC